MKENTKFLWMYVAILFSFALILIIFAGLSSNNTTEQTQGLKADITELSHKNTQLQNENKSLLNQLEIMTQQHDAKKREAEALVADAEEKNANDALLMAAVKAQDAGNYAKSKEIKSTIIRESLTEAQLYIYNKLVY